MVFSVYMVSSVYIQIFQICEFTVLALSFPGGIPIASLCQGALIRSPIDKRHREVWGRDYPVKAECRIP